MRRNVCVANKRNMQNLWAKDVQLKRLHVELLSLRLNKNARQNWLAKLN